MERTYALWKEEGRPEIILPEEYENLEPYPSHEEPDPI
jgi:hypothetical protein